MLSGLILRLFDIITILVFLVGIYSVFTQRNLIQIMMGINIMEAAVLLLLVSHGYVAGRQPPIIMGEGVYADPVPQALALTAVVIGASVTALGLSIIVKIGKYYGTLDVREIRRLRG